MMENEMESIHNLLSTTADNSPVGNNNLKTLLGKIEENLKTSDKHGLDNNIAIIFGHDDEDVEGKNVVAFIKSCLSSKSHYVVEFLKFMEHLCVHYPEVLINYVEKIIDISMRCVLSNSVTTNSGVAVHGNNLVRTAVETFHGSGYDFSRIYDFLKRQINLECIKRPKVYLAFFKLVGVLCKLHPDSVQQGKCKLFKEAVYKLAVEGRNDEDKRSYPVIEGSFEAINGLLFLFTTDELMDLSNELNKIYDSMKLVINADSLHRHSPHRAAFSIIENHSEKISYQLKRDYVYWHEVMIKWIDHNNKDDKGISMRAYNAFINHMAKLLSIEQSEEPEEEIAKRKQMLEFFLVHLTKKLSGEGASNVAAAVEGIGVFAPALATIRDHSQIEKLFEDLVQKIDLLVSDVDSNVFYLSEYLGALARVGAVLHENLNQHQLENLERFSVKLISACNTLPSNKLDAAVNSIGACCFTALVARGKVGLKNFINVIVYQGIIKACCQQPFVKQERSDFEETTSFKVVVDDYLPFWEKLLLIHKNEKIGDADSLYRKEVIVELVYEAIIESIVKVINNLDVNFEESNFDDANTEPTSGLKAHNDADMAILMNLEFLFSKLLPKIEIRLHEKYISLLLRNLTSVSTQNPLVPSYYKLLTTVLSIAEQMGFFEADNRFEDSDLCQTEINYYIGDLLVNLHHYHKDVQEACLRVITSSSVELIASHLQQLPAAFEVLFHIGRSDLELSSMGVSALDRWMSKLSREELTPFFKQVIPHLYLFLDNRRIKVAFPDEYTEYAQRSNCRSKHVSKRRKLVEQWRKESSLGETQLSQLQQAILMLLGRLDMQSLLSLLDQDYTDVVSSWARKPVVTWLMQFRELHVPLNLDAFAPRAMEIALQSSDPANKDASFELLHAIFVIFLVNAPTDGETTDDHKQFLRKMLQGLFKLGCKTSDPVGRNIFNNLLHQTCHWFARKCCGNKKFLDIFVNSMLEALTYPTDIEVREFAAECLHEYISWTLKPTDEERSLSKAAKQDIVPREIEYILSKITSYCDHPCPFKRQGAAMGFNRIYRELREQLASVVDHFWLELFCAFVKSLLLEHPSREVFAALDHICRVLVERPEGFNVASEARRRPPEFEGVLLKHAVKWLMAKCNSSNERCRQKCMQMVDKLVVKVQGINSLNDFIETESIDMLEMCKMKTTSKITSMSDLLLWMNSLSASIHMLKWLKENEFDVVSAVRKSENSWFLENLNHYISKISSCSAGSIDWLSEESSPFCPQLSTTDAYDRARRQVTFNLLAFLAALEEDLITITQFLHKDVWQLLSRCLSSPAFIGFTTVSQNQLNTLRSALSQLLTKLQKHLGNNILKENFVGPNITKLASSLPENEHGKLATNLSELIRRQSISVELNSLNTLIVLKQINLLDADDQGLIKDETLWNSENLIQAIANCLVRESDKAIKPNKSQTLYLELLLEFAFMLQTESNISKLIECMCDETKLKYEDDDQSKDVTKGQHFTNTLNEKIFAHLCQFPAESVKELLKRFSEKFDFISKCLCTLLDRCSNCEDSVKSNIATLIDKYFPNSVSRELLDSAIPLIYSIRDFLPGNNIRRSKLNNIYNFISKGMKTYEYITNQRPRILKTFLQICLIGNSSTHEESDADLRKTLDRFMYINIPISSKEWRGNSDSNKEMFNILLEMVRDTGNKDLVMLVAKYIADDPAHLFREKFKSILGQSSVILKNNSAAILDELYKFRNDKILKPHNRAKLVQDFMLPIIESTSFKQAEEFFLEHIKDIVVSLKDETNQNKKINSSNLETLVPPRAASMLLINALFSKFPSSELTSIMCPIVQKSEEIDKDKSGKDTAVLLRTCTARVLNYLEDELNNAAKDNLKDQYELYLSYKQIAFNTLVILISNTKRDVKSFQIYGLIFKNVKFVMPRELITISNMVFDEIPKRRQAQIGIRRAVRSEKRKRRNSTSSIESYQLFTQSLGNSTFADEVRKYDFMNSVLREEYTSSHENEDTDQMIVELEADRLNSHPCMPSLCGAITNLHKITTDANASTSDATPKVDDKTPVWITCISKALESSSNEHEEINAKLLLIKLLYNCNETDANIFTPYAKKLLPPIIKFIIEYKVRCFDNKMNYMIGDILGMLTSWSSVATPEKNEIYQLLSFLMEKTPNDRKDVMKLNIEIIKTVISSWKDNISVIPHEKILDLLSDTDPSKIGTSIEIICCLLNNNIKPYAEESLDRFYRTLEQKVHIKKDRSIRQKSAEILGMLYRFLSISDGNSSSLIEERFALENLTKQILQNALNKSANPDGLDNMILFTSLMKNHYPRIVTYFINNIVPLLSKVKGDLQQHVLDIVNTALELDDINEKHYSDELYLGINSQLITVFRLGNVDTQETALKVVVALRDFLDYDNLSGLMLEVVKHFSNHSRLTCRNAYYDVLMNVYEFYQTTPCAGSIEVSWSDLEKLSAKDLVRNALVSGLEDANEELRNKMFQFWNNEGRVRTDLVDRLEDLFKLLYSPDLESSFLSLFLQLLLNVCQLSPAYHSCVFPDRRGLSTNQSEILDMKQSRVNSASVAPILVRTVTTEGKSSYNSFGSGMGSSTRIRGTQQSLLFEPTVNPADGPPIPAVGSSSLHSFAFDATVSQNRTSHSKRSYAGNGSDDDGDFKVPDNKARRLHSDKEKIGQSAAFMNQRRNAIMQTELMEQKTKMESAVHLTRTYTKDHLPDRTLTNENVVVCLLKFAKKDMTIASELLTSLLKGIIHGYQNKCSEPHNQEQSKQLLEKVIMIIDEAFKRIMGKTKQATRGVISVILDTCHEFSKLPLSSSKCIDELYDVSNRSGLHSLGALVLENSLTNSLVPEQNNSNTWVYLARLYRSLGFSEIVQGIFEEKLAGVDVREALEAETAGEWREAIKKYQTIAKDLQRGKVDEEGDFVYEAYFNCMARMGDWNGLKEALVNVNEVDQMWNDSWSKENLLPWLFRAELNSALMSSETKDNNSFYETYMKVWLNDREKSDYIKTNIGEELSMLYLVNKSIDKASEVSQNNRKLFLEDWMQLPALSHNLIMDKCLKLQRLMDIESAVTVLRASKLGTADWFPNCIDLLEKWDSNPPMKNDSLSHWEIRTKYRAHFCGAVMKKCENPEISSFESRYYMSLLDLALNHENAHLAKKVLRKVNKKEPMVIAGKSRAELLLARMFETRDLNEMLKKIAVSWKTIDYVNRLPKLDLQVKLISQKHVTEICSTLHSVLSTNDNKLELFNNFFKDTFPKIDESDCVLTKLYETGLKSLETAVQIADEIVGVNSKADLAETYLTLAKYCQQENDRSITVESKMIESLLRAMKLGSKEARYLFPIILSLPRLAQSHSRVFIEESQQVPAWMFLSWANQMLARIDTEIGPTLEPVLLRLASEYPSALKYLLNIRSTNFTSPAAKDTFDKLKSLAPFDDLTWNFVEAIKYVILPETLLFNCLMDIKKSILCKESESDVETKWNELERLANNLFSDTAPSTGNFKGSLYIAFKDKNEGMANKLRELLVKRPLIVDDDSYPLLLQTVEDSRSLKSERKELLDAFSTWFDSYQSLPHRIEIPGQYSGDNMPVADKMVKISKFSDRFTVMSSLRKPVKISVIGNDGIEYGLLVKQGEDLRQDERIMQALRQMDSFLTLDNANANSPVIKYSLKTYNVIPFTSNLGLLSWVDGSTSLENFILSCIDKKEYDKTIENYVKWLPSGASEKHQYHNLYCEVSRPKTVKNFRKNVNSLPQDILRRGILELSQSAESYHYLRTQFGSSLSAMSVCHWLLGIGDRHLANSLLCVGSGQLCGIDFGYAFGSATEVIGIPELLPFRLTPQMLNLFEPFRVTGLIKESMCRCLEILRKRKLLIMASIEVFIHEPLMDWAQQAKYCAILNGVDISETDYNSRPREKIERARKKLDGANPVQVMTEDLESGHANKPYLKYLKSMLEGEEGNVRSSKPKYGLTVREQVECLIDLATDEHILGKSYAGLKAWV